MTHLSPSPTTPIASTSKGDSQAMSNHQDSSHQRLLYHREILDQLGEKEGILIDELDGLFEKCGI